MATTTRLFGSTTTIRSSNFTNLWPCTGGTSRAMPAGRSAAAPRSAAHRRPRVPAVGNRRILATHHALVDAAALFVAQRELRRRALAAGSAASSLFHCRCIRALTAATVRADLGCRSKAKACDHDDECRPFCALPRDRAERLDNVRIPASQLMIIGTPMN